MITPCPPVACGLRGDAWGGQLYRSTSGQVLVSAEGLALPDGKMDADRQVTWMNRL